MNVPKDVQQLVGKKELRYSLKTGYVGVARVKAQIIAAQVHQIFACLRKGGKMVDLSDERIRELVQQYLKEYIKGLETRHFDEDSPIVTRDDFRSYISSLDSIKEDIIEYLGIGDYEMVEQSVAVLLEKNGIERIEKGSAAYVKLCRGVLRAQLQGIEIEKKQMLSGFEETPDVSFREQLPSSRQIPNGREQGQLISEVIDKYADEAKINWRAKTKDENLSILNLFKEVVGDVPIQSINRMKVGEFKQRLMKLPPNMKKNPRYRKKSISEILKMEVPKTLSKTTVAKYLTRVGALFEYARKRIV
jgi:hypothetical protein